MPPAARQSERAWAVYRRERLYLVLLPGAGGVWGCEGQQEPVAQHNAVRGVFRQSDRRAELLDALSHAADGEQLVTALEALGYQVRLTPRSALEATLPPGELDRP